MGLRIVPQVLEEAVPQSDNSIILINQYVANRGSHVFSECWSQQPSNAKAELRDSESVNLKPFVSRHIPRVTPPSTVTQVPVM
jgi:hypothetical protein